MGLTILRESSGFQVATVTAKLPACKCLNSLLEPSICCSPAMSNPGRAVRAQGTLRKQASEKQARNASGQLEKSLWQAVSHGQDARHFQAKAYHPTATKRRARQEVKLVHMPPNSHGTIGSHRLRRTESLRLAALGSRFSGAESNGERAISGRRTRSVLAEEACVRARP